MIDQLNTLIKPSLSNEIEAWLAEGNSITYLSISKTQKEDKSFNNRPIKPAQNQKYQRDVKHRATRPEQQAKWSDVLILKNWLEAKVGRMEALGKEVNLNPAYLSQIKNSKRKCSKERMAELLEATKRVELTELVVKYCGEKE